MHKTDSKEFCKDAAGQLHRAEVETVLITRNGEPAWALVSFEVFSQLRRGNRNALKVSDLSDEDVAGIRDARMSPQHNHLDSELGNDGES